MIDCLGREMNCCVFIAALVAVTFVEVSITSGQTVSGVKHENDCHCECCIAACSDSGQDWTFDTECADSQQDEPRLPTHTLAITRHFVQCEK